MARALAILVRWDSPGGQAVAVPDTLPIQQDDSGIRFNQKSQNLKQAGFSRTIGSDNRQNFAAIQHKLFDIQNVSAGPTQFKVFYRQLDRHQWPAFRCCK
jgi:hypothetical protein